MSNRHIILPIPLINDVRRRVRIYNVFDVNEFVTAVGCPSNVCVCVCVHVLIFICLSKRAVDRTDDAVRIFIYNKLQSN